MGVRFWVHWGYIGVIYRSGGILIFINFLALAVGPGL